MKPVIEAFERLGLKVPEYRVNVSGRFSAYNANVVKTWNYWEFNLSKKWKGVDDEIVIGLIQSLIVRFYKKKRESVNIDLYENFVKRIHLVTPKTLNDPLLEESYNRVNDEFFMGMVTRPNLKWGHYSKRTLGTYDYKSDLITISSIFKKADKGLLDYVMYHELLHKRHKFYSKNGKSYHHTSKFRKDEKSFGDEMEKRLNAFLKSLSGKKIVVKKGFFERLFG
jgi:predicted SprT family Zn-dependent metalloprotease